MTVLVVGATGTLGRQITRRALDEGYGVRCLVRNFRRASFLKEWGAELAQGDLRRPESLAAAMEGVTAVIDASTARPTDSSSIQEIDWDGKVALINAARAQGVERYVFLSILNCDQYPHVPLMEVKRCTELFLKESGLNYTILRTAGFLQGLIGQYAIPILERQAVWVTGDTSPIAYIDTQDVAKFAVNALKVSETEHGTFPVVGSRAWGAYEIIRLCERLSGQEARIWRMPTGLLKNVEKFARFFQWGWNLADRLAFAEVISSGKPLTADMESTYKTFGIDPQSLTTLEGYMQEYFNRIMKKLKEVEYERERAKQKKKKKSLFK
ncbi:MAG: SDR family oxidoreductase [Kaiparowitsia implicata GSE-PSE-MK54-09C]|nr:SDR family oxidoreductase [Kaiparowitsia implicata GSE-PSE-MK54-09C]